MKRILATAIAVSMLVGSLAGCGKVNDTVSDGKTNITFSFWEPGIEKELETSLKKVIDSYEELHPEVNIELISQPVDGYQEWIKTQIIADNLPDIVSNHANVLEEQYKAGVVVDISDAFNSPNPYNNDLIWKDTFMDGRLDQAHQYKYDASFAVPFFGTGLAMFYNKTLYDELNLKAPKTWNEFLANCEVIQKTGKVPVALMARKASAVNWLDWELEVGLFGQKYLSDPNLNFNGDCTLVSNEINKAVLDGYLDYTKNEEYREMYKIFIKTFQDYLKYCPDASGLDEAAAKTMFLAGTAAHIHSGSWDIRSLMMNKDVKFEIGTFEFPTFTKENSPYAGKGMTTASAQTVAVTSNVNKQEGKKEIAIDFLKYLTSPEVYSEFINETMQLPVMKDVTVDPVFDGFMKDGYSPINLFIQGSDKEGTSFRSVLDLIISGENVEINDELFANVQKSINRLATDEANKNEWTMENNFKIGELVKIGGEFVAEN